MLIKGKLVKENDSYKINTELFGQNVLINCTLSKHLIESFENNEGKEFVYKASPYTKYSGSGENYTSYLCFDIFKKTKETKESEFFNLKVYVTGVYLKSETNKESFILADVIVGGDSLPRKKIRLSLEDEEISNIKETVGYNSFICTIGVDGKVCVVCKDEETRR